MKKWVMVGALLCLSTAPVHAQQFTQQEVQEYSRVANELMQSMPPETRDMMMRQVMQMVNQVNSMSPEEKKRVTRQMEQMGRQLYGQIKHVDPSMLGSVGVDQAQRALEEAQRKINAR